LAFWKRKCNTAVGLGGIEGGLGLKVVEVAGACGLIVGEEGETDRKM